jgi:AraC-like DNA-binding protein
MGHLVEQLRHDSRAVVRPIWLDAVVAATQRLALRSQAIDLDDARGLLTDFVDALPTPEGQLERVILRTILVEVAWRSARTVHKRAHRGRPEKCAFAAAATLDAFWQVPPQHPKAAFRAWLEAFAAGFKRTHPASVATRVRRLIKQDYRGQWSLHDLAGRFHITPSRLSRGFAKQFGESIHKYQRGIRLVAALARVPNGKIDGIALEVGYRSKKNFYRAFRQLAGMTPTAFRHLSPERAAAIVEAASRPA